MSTLTLAQPAVAQPAVAQPAVTPPAVPHPQVRRLPDSRPPSVTWARPSSMPLDHPQLAFEALTLALAAPPQPTGHSVHLANHPWVATVTSSMPDPRPWSAFLSLALAQALQGHRPVGQLSRWVDERVLATLHATRRNRRGTAAGKVAVRPAVLRSVRLQCPQPRAVEVSAHVQLGAQSAALAFRLEVGYDRWLCTALELGPASRW